MPSFKWFYAQHRVAVKKAEAELMLEPGPALQLYFIMKPIV